MKIYIILRNIYRIIKLMPLRLIADHRERAVKPYLRERAEYQQLATGDYVILDANDKVVVIIERKSLTDYAASIKDGRHSNRLRMMTLGVPVIYLIEGTQPRNPSCYIGGIPWSAIESSIFHIQVRDNIKVIWSHDIADTAEILCRFVISMDNLVLKGELAGAETTMEDVKLAEAPTLSGQILSAWSKLPGIGAETAVFYAKKFSIAEISLDGSLIDGNFICGRRKISTKTYGATQCISEYSSAILCSIEGIGPVKCKTILASGDWINICSKSVAELAEIRNAKGSRVVSSVLAQKIYDVLHNKVE